MWRGLGGIVLVIALAGVAPAGASAARAPVAGDSVAAPRVGFRPLFAPWWVERVARETGDDRALTALYLADGGTPESGRGFALVRSRAVPGAEICGAPTGSPPILGGPFARADIVQNGSTVVVRRADLRPGRAMTVLVARGLTTEEIRGLATGFRVIRGVLAPRSIPNDMHLAGLAPVDATLTTGPGTVLSLVGGISPDRRVLLHATVVRGPARLAARFFRTTSLRAVCTPDRIAIIDRGNAVIAAVSTEPGNAATVASMVRRVDAARFAEVTRWARRPGVTQLARRCTGLGMVTIAGDNHDHVWGVGLPAAVGPTCVASRSGGTTTPPGPVSDDAIAVSIRRRDTCGLVLVAGRAPPATRRVVVRAGRARPQTGHRRSGGPSGTPPAALWAALVRAAPVRQPPITITAYDGHGKVVGRRHLAAGSAAPCRAGRRL